VLIIQNDEYLESRLKTAICVGITSNSLISEAPGNVVLKKKESGLSRESIVNVSQILTIDKRFLIERAGKITREKLGNVEKGILLSIGIEAARYTA
jgi:mRNA interferase MazF